MRNDYGAANMKITRWIIRIILFLLVLVLILNNKNIVDFNFYGIYTLSAPLIILCLIFLLIGLIIGMGYGFLRSLELKAKIKVLQEEIKNVHKTNNNSLTAD